MIKFNRNSKYGKHLVEAIVPGWGFGEALNTGSPKGSIRVTGGRRNVEFTAQALGTPTASIKTRTYPYQFGGDVRVIECAQQDQNSGYRFGTSLGDLGPIKAGTRRFTALGIVKLIGDGVPGTADPRIYSKDLNATEAGHDLMFGFVSGSFNVARTRVNLGGTTRTLFLPDNVDHHVVNDGWHLVAVTAEPVSTSTRVHLHCLYPDGRYRSATNEWVGTYSPRTSTDEALFSNAGVNDNTFGGSIMAVYFFEDVTLSAGDLQQLYERPWQVFAPQRFYIPMTQEVVTITQEPVGPITATGGPIITKPTASGSGYRTIVKITDVNGTETWQDGATGITISGTGFT